MLFGSSAVAWSFYLLFRCAMRRNYQEVWHTIAQIMWLYANLWWMQGELHDYQFPDEPPMMERRQSDAGYMMMVAILWLGIYYAVIKPLGYFPITDENRKEYDDTGLVCRYNLLFPTWRQYENIHILFWLGKDCAWNLLIPVMWIVFLIPTVLIACDFMVTACLHKVSTALIFPNTYLTSNMTNISYLRLYRLFNHIWRYYST